MLQNLSEHIRESKRMAQVLFWILNKETAEIFSFQAGNRAA
jgi:hypothetical protein